MTGTDIGLAIIGVALPLTAAILKFAPNRSNTKLNADFVRTEVCNARHDGVKDRLDTITTELLHLRVLMERALGLSSSRPTSEKQP